MDVSLPYTLPYYDNIETIYVIDTCGLIKLESTFPPNNSTFHAVWQEIDILISQHCFRTIDFVEQEINEYVGEKDFLKKWVAKRKKELVFETTQQCYEKAIPIINSEFNTGFFDAKKQAEGKEEADVYLIAYSIVNNCTLITNESKTKPNKIPAVSRKNGIKCIDIYDFIQERGLIMIRTK
ncbi:MAG: hypothetical protein HW421_2043 [Ignavibacteria bacterium]|nr:hypothetical protein [Ignavibacteria bacterium]